MSPLREARSSILEALSGSFEAFIGLVGMSNRSYAFTIAS
jgi:hypothetical protein